MTAPRQAQLPLLLSISEGLSRGTDEMLRVSPLGDAIHPPSCSLAIREAVEEIERLRAENKRLFEEVERIDDLFLSREKTLFTQRCEIERLRADRVHRIDLRAEAWEEGWFARDCQKSDWNENPYRGEEGNERHN